MTQQFNTTKSIGRLTLNILLSFAQFEREIISERTRDKMSAARRKGKWIGGHPVLGYDIDPKGGRLIVNPEEAEQVRTIFGLYLELGSLLPVLQEADRRGLRDKALDHRGWQGPGRPAHSKGTLHGILTNVIYTGMVDHKGMPVPGRARADHRPEHVGSGAREPSAEQRRDNGRQPEEQVRRLAAKASCSAFRAARR